MPVQRYRYEKSIIITLKTKKMKTFVSKSVLMAATLLATCFVAEAQFGKKVLDKVVQNASEKQESVSSVANTNASVTNGKAYYVSIEKGSARGAGTKEAPMKDIQKAIDSAADGDVIRIAQGNYLGPLDRGWIQIKGKYVSLEGGWNDDFTERNPVRYITRIQPGIEQRGTIGQGLLMIESTANRNGQIIVDGLFFDLGLSYRRAFRLSGRMRDRTHHAGGKSAKQDHTPHRRKGGRQARHPQLHVPERFVQRNHHDKHGRRLGNIQQRVRLQSLCIL